MKAIILAAGRGSRMGEFTETLPKCLTKVRGQALLDLQIQALERAGLDQLAIVTGYKRNTLSGRNLIEFHNSRWNNTNMVTSLAYADAWLKEQPCIVSYSDIFYESQAVELLMQSDASLSILFDVNWLDLWRRRFGDPLVDAETFRLNPEGKLIEIGNDPKTLDEIQGQYMGLLRFTPESWEEACRIRASLPDSVRDVLHMTGLIQRIIEAGRIEIEAIPFDGDWGEVDTQSDVSVYS